METLNILIPTDFSVQAEYAYLMVKKLENEIETNMKRFAELNDISNYECHHLNDKDLESGVVHFNQMHEMDIICIGAHGKAGVFQGSETEKLVNHLFKPILSFQFNSAIKS